MFVDMEAELQTWAERLDKLSKGGKIALTADDISASVYSGAWKLKDKKFTIRTAKKTKVRYVIRLK